MRNRNPFGRSRCQGCLAVWRLRQGDWKYIEPGKGPTRAANTNLELGNDPGGLLFNLAADPGERNNLAAQQPERLKQLTTLLERIRESKPRQP